MSVVVDQRSRRRSCVQFSASLTLGNSQLFSRAAVSSKNGVSHNVDAGNLVGLSEISDYDVTIAKPCELLGQACDVELSMQKCKSVRD
jgi:hypothetical protein